MMKYLSLPDAAREVRILPFYLSMEEYAARRVRMGEDIFFMWQVAPTVIFGRNQVIDDEVNVAYCREHGIEFYRRRSGGGCVYADMDNVMMSYITRDEGADVPTTFARYTGAVAEMLRGLGLDASDNSRNDVLIGDRKVSGNSFYHLSGGVSIVHGTMLIDTDMEHMLHALTPSREKLSGKGVQSVRSRITTLREHLPEMTAEAFMRYARETLCDGEVVLTEDDVKEIEVLTQRYLEPSFIAGRKHHSTVQRRGRVEGVGELVADIDVRQGRVADVTLGGDYLDMSEDASAVVTEWLRGAELTSEGLRTALAGKDVGTVIMNLKNEQFINLLTN